MKTLRNLYLTVAALLLLALSPSASAKLCQNANWGGPNAVPIPDIVVDPSAQVGDVLHVIRFESSGTSSSGTCLSGTVTMNFTGANALIAPNTYDAGIPGVGYRLQMTRGGCTSAYFPTSCTGIFGPGIPAHTMEMTLVKTGPITSGTRPTGYVAFWRDNYNYPAYTDDFAVFTLNTTISVRVRQPPTCSVSSAGPIKASLGDFPTKSFTGVGSTSPARPFNIDLKCKGGDPGMSAEAHVTLTDATNTGNRSNVLTLSPGSQAKGVGIEVLKGDSVLGYGPDSNATGNLNQWHAGTISTGMSTFSIPLTARYVQTDPVVTPGTANGRATFTMSYQ